MQAALASPRRTLHFPVDDAPKYPSFPLSASQSPHQTSAMSA